jgi:hypothetical protein
MANINKFSPVSPDTFLKAGSDMAFAKFGHLNAIVDAYNTVDTSVATNTNILSLNGLTASTTLTTRVDAISNTGATYTGALKANSITEYTSGSGVTINGALELKKTVPVTSKSATYVLTAVEAASGYVAITGATNSVTLQLPTATALATQIGATAGTTFDIILDATAATGTAIGLAVNTGITAVGTLTFNGSATTYPAYRITFISTTSALVIKLY